MKDLIGKFRISLALNSRKPISAGLRQTIAGSRNLQAFEQCAQALDRELKRPKVAAETPAGLHNAIMRRIRETDEAAENAVASSFTKWVPVPAGLALAAILAWALVFTPNQREMESGDSALNTAVTALQVGEQVGNAMPTALATPMAEELERLNRDLDETARFVLASLP